jgi:glutathione S-transferase
MTSYRLHYFPESGNSYKLGLMLTLCGQSFEPVWTDFGGGVTRTPEWRATVNEMGEIPVLEEDGVRLTQTAPILLQLADRYGRSASVLSIAYVLVLGESYLKHVFREVLQDAGRINHAGVDLLRVHLDGQEVHAGVQRLELVAHVRERRLCGDRGAA